MERFRSPGVSLRSTARLNLDFFLREKSCRQFSVVGAKLYGLLEGSPRCCGGMRASFHSPLQRLANQLSARSCRGYWKAARDTRVVLPAVPHQNFREKHRRYTGGNLQNDKEVVEGFLGKSLLYLQKMNLLWNYDDKR